MRLALVALFFVACDPTEQATDPDLSRYALQADLDAALVEIDELREQVATMEGQAASTPVVTTSACTPLADSGTGQALVTISGAATLLSAQICVPYEPEESTAYEICETVSGTSSTTPEATTLATVADERCDDDLLAYGKFVYLPATE